jgi:hypothetical protein
VEAAVPPSMRLGPDLPGFPPSTFDGSPFDLGRRSLLSITIAAHPFSITTQFAAVAAASRATNLIDPAA